MGVRRDYLVRPPHAVFQSIDMKGGDKNQCWPWLGYFDKLTGQACFYWGNRRYRAQRWVYALRKGIHVDDVPQLAWLCGNRKCCNPYHLTERHGLAERVTGYPSRSSDNNTYIFHQVT